jgi:hypothetical protein
VVAEAAEHAKLTGEVLPVLPALADLLPWRGLRRGSTIAIQGSTSLLLALLAEATARGSWAAVVGMPWLGIAAASELGAEVSRLALVPRPGADSGSVTAALLDGLDVVATPPPARSGDSRTARSLSSRARHRGAVLLSLGTWPGADVELRCRSVSWSGPAGGHGYLREREVVVDITGRGALGKSSRAALLLPGPDGSVAAIEHGDPAAAVPTGEVRAV